MSIGQGSIFWTKHLSSYPVGEMGLETFRDFLELLMAKIKLPLRVLKLVVILIGN